MVMQPFLRHVSGVLIVYLFAVVMCSFLLEFVLHMQPCVLCYLGRGWLVGLLLLAVVTDVAKWPKTFLTLWAMAVATNMYHLYLIYFAPPQTACMPWALIHFKNGWLAKWHYALDYFEHNMSSCQSDAHLFLGVGLPWWLLAVHGMILILFLLISRKRHAL